MIKRILIALAVVLAIVMATLAMTKPDRKAHYEAVKGMALKVVDHELSSNPLTKEHAAVGLMIALNEIDEYLQRNLIVYEHTFYTNGILLYKDMFVPISIGIFGNVYLTIDEEKVKKYMLR